MGDAAHVAREHAPQRPVGLHPGVPGLGVYPGVGIFNSPRSAVRARAEDGAFRPALWPPEEAAQTSPTPPIVISSAEDTLLKWQFELGGGLRLEPAGEGALFDSREVPLHGLHRVDHSQDDGDSTDLDEDDSTDQGEDQTHAFDCTGSPDTSAIKTSTTISKVVEFIGQRIQEVHAEMKSPRKYLSEDQDLFFNTEISDPLRTQPASSDSFTMHDGSRTTRHIMPKANCSFLLAKVVSSPDEENSACEVGAESAETQKTEIDQNAVAEWWSNLMKFKPGAPSRQAQLIRSTHDKLEQMLMKKDERIEVLYTQAISFERSFQAAEIFGRSVVMELDAVCGELRELHDFSRNYLTTSGHESEELRAQHIKELTCLERRLEDAHAKEIAELQAKLREELRAKEDALSKVKQLQDEEARLATQLSAETDKMRALLEQKDAQLKLLQAKEEDLKQQQQSTVELLQQNKEAELKLLAAEHLAALRAKDAELLERIESLSKAKMAEIQAAVDEHRAAMQRRDEEYAELRAKKDAELEELEKKHKAELDAFGESMSRKVDDLLAQVRAKVSANEELQQQLDDCRDRMSRGLTEKQESLRAALRDLDDARAELERMKTELDREVERRKTSERNGDELSKGLELEILELKRRLEVSDRDSATEIARLRAEIERLKAELEHERAKRRELESKLRLAEESLRRAKLVGIGMRITDGTPHQITEIIEGGAAHLSGALQVGDYLVEVAQMDVNVHSISEIRNFILGPAGSYLDLKIDRRGADDEPNLFSVKIKRSELVALNEHAQSKASAPLVTAPRPAPASASPPDASDAMPGARGSKKKRASAAGYVPGPFF